MKSQQIRQQYLHLLPKLEEVAGQVKARLQKLPKGFEWEVNLKPYDSLREKAEFKEVNNIAELADLVRGRILFPPPFTYEQVIGKLAAPELLGKWLREVDDKEKKEDGFEYVGPRHLDLHIDNVRFELQIIPIAFKPYLPLLHRVYEMHQHGHHDYPKDKIDRIKKLHNRMYELLDRLYRVRRGLPLETDGK
jgi:hypothetical protein